jgi:hypothetical protein
MIIASTSAPPMAVDAADGEDVGTFIRDHNLATYIKIACSLVARHFASADDLTIEKCQDPEIDEEWLTLRVKAAGEVESVLDAYDAMTRDLVGSLPPEISRKIRISLEIP